MSNLKPQYEVHRRWGDGSEAPAAESSDLTNAALKTAAIRGKFSARGLKTVHGFVQLSGGSSETISLQAVEIATYKTAGGVEQQVLLARSAPFGPLSDGDAFTIETPGGGLYYLRVHSLAGSPTTGAVHIAKGEASLPS